MVHAAMYKEVGIEGFVSWQYVESTRERRSSYDSQSIQ